MVCNGGCSLESLEMLNFGFSLGSGNDLRIGVLFLDGLAKVVVLTLSGIWTGIFETLRFALNLGGSGIRTRILEGELRLLDLVKGGVARIGLLATNLS